MTIELQVLRHGKAKKANTQELKKSSKLQAQLLGQHLLANNRVPHSVFYDGGNTSYEAVAKCCKVMGYPGNSIQAFSGFSCFAKTAASTSANRILIATEQSNLYQLLKIQCEPSVTTRLSRNTLTRFTVDSANDSLRVSYLSCTEAKQLAQTFGYPTPDAAEQRLRPPYYYQQSAAIPFRRGKNGLKVMLVGSSGGHHRGVPKGIIDPGLTAWESAAKEAWEEAGVTGEIEQSPLGRFHYEKWGACCNVEVFALAVERVCESSDWQERHRGRQWLSLNTAKQTVKYKQLIPFLDLLEHR